MLFYSSESVQKTYFRRTAEGRADAAWNCLTGVQGDRRTDAQVTMVQRRQGDQSWWHIRADGKFRRRLPGHLHVRGDKCHGHRAVYVKNTSDSHASRRKPRRRQVCGNDEAIICN